jgi:hypothetical protein
MRAGVTNSGRMASAQMRPVRQLVRIRLPIGCCKVLHQQYLHRLDRPHQPGLELPGTEVLAHRRDDAFPVALRHMPRQAACSA